MKLPIEKEDADLSSLRQLVLLQGCNDNSGFTEARFLASAAVDL